MSQVATDSTSTSVDATERFDVIVIGAGPAGLYQLHTLREKGLHVRVLERGSGVGGTWYWNRHPGARLHSESYTYQYFWSEELLKEWKWSEVFAAQPELERYYNFVADKYDLRKDIEFDTNISAMNFDEAADDWQLTATDGRTFTAHLVVAAAGMLSAPIYPKVPGIDTFAGESYHTSRWPKDPVDFAGKKVAVIGTGASGVQVIPRVAETAEHLTIFMRTPNYVAPLQNHVIDAAEAEQLQASYQEIHDLISDTALGFTWEPEPRPTTDYTPEELKAHYEQRWTEPGWAKIFGLPYDILMAEEPNQGYAQFMNDKMRPRVKDPALAELLTPTHPVMAKPVDFDVFNYYEVFDQDNVDVVFVKNDPIEEITPRGVRVASGEVEVDIIIYATGFEVMTGAFKRIDISGIDGHRLKDAWDERIVTYLGLEAPDFPNLFILGGPHGRAGTGNCPITFEYPVQWIAELAEKVTREGIRRVEADPVAAEEWTERVFAEGEVGIGARSDVSNYAYGTNVEGQKRQFLASAIRLPEFNARLKELAESDYVGGFTLTR